MGKQLDTVGSIQVANELIAQSPLASKLQDKGSKWSNGGRYKNANLVNAMSFAVRDLKDTKRSMTRLIEKLEATGGREFGPFKRVQ